MAYDKKGRPCSICSHPQRAAIDEALANNGNLSEIGRKYGVIVSSLSRHRDNHLPSTLLKATEAKEVARADDLLAQVKDLQERTLTILAQAEADGDRKVAVSAIREARGNLELLAKLVGELKEGQTVNIILAPEWLSLRTIILNTLEPYPEAKVRLAEALVEVEQNAGK